MNGVMTSNEKHRWVFPLSPTARAYAKLNGYFAGISGCRIRSPSREGRFWCEFISSGSFATESTNAK